MLNRKLVRKYSLDLLLKVATSIAMMASLLLVTLVKLEIGGILGIVIPMFVVFSTNGIIAACTNAAALDKVPKMAGSGAALLGSLQYGSGVISSMLLAVFASQNGNPWTMSWIIALFMCLSAVTIFFGIRRK